MYPRSPCTHTNLQRLRIYGYIWGNNCNFTCCWVSVISGCRNSNWIFVITDNLDFTIYNLDNIRLTAFPLQVFGRYIVIKRCRQCITLINLKSQTLCQPKRGKHNINGTLSLGTVSGFCSDNSVTNTNSYYFSISHRGNRRITTCPSYILGKSFITELCRQFFSGSTNFEVQACF